MNKRAIEFQQNLEQKLKRLCFIHDQPRLHLANEFYELRNTIDIETEKLLVRLQKAKIENKAEKVAKANETRSEFIRILRELEEKCFSQLPQISYPSFMEVTSDFRTRIEEFKACSSKKLEDAFFIIGFALLEEIYQLERRLFCEQTILYLSSNDKNQLGTLVYISEDHLRFLEVGCLRYLRRNPKKEFTYILHDPSSVCSKNIRGPIVDKYYMIVSRLDYYFKSTPAPAKFIYMGKDDEQQYTGYRPKNACIETQFISYRFPIEKDKFDFYNASFSPSFDVLDFFLANKFQLRLNRCWLTGQDILAYPSAARIVNLELYQCVFKPAKEDFIARCVNLKQLCVDPRTLHILRFDPKLPGPARSLTELNVLAHKDRHFKLPSLANLVKLENLLLYNINEDPLILTSFTEDNLKALAVIPRLTQLAWMHCNVSSVGAFAFADFKNLKRAFFLGTKIGHLHEKAFVRESGETIQHRYIEDRIWIDIARNME